MHAPRFDRNPGQITPAAPSAVAGVLVACPAALRPCQPGMVAWMHEVYRRAYEQARAALEPTWYDRAAVPSAN